MGYTMEEKKRIIVDTILSIETGITEKDLEKMLWAELDKPADEMDMNWVNEMLDALAPASLSETAEAAFIEKMAEILGLND